MYHICKSILPTTSMITDVHSSVGDIGNVSCALFQFHFQISTIISSLLQIPIHSVFIHPSSRLHCLSETWTLNSLNVLDSSLWQFVFAFSPVGTFLLHLCVNIQRYIIFTKQNKLSCNIFAGSQTHAEKKSKSKLSFTPSSLMMSFFSIFWGEIGLWSHLHTKQVILSITGLLICVPLGISSIVQCEQWF